MKVLPHAGTALAILTLPITLALVPLVPTSARAQTDANQSASTAARADSAAGKGDPEAERRERLISRIKEQQKTEKAEILSVNGRKLILIDGTKEGVYTSDSLRMDNNESLQVVIEHPNLLKFRYEFAYEQLTINNGMAAASEVIKKLTGLVAAAPVGDFVPINLDNVSKPKPGGLGSDAPALFPWEAYKQIRQDTGVADLCAKYVCLLKRINTRLPVEPYSQPPESELRNYKTIDSFREKLREETKKSTDNQAIRTDTRAVLNGYPCLLEKGKTGGKLQISKPVSDEMENIASQAVQIQIEANECLIRLEGDSTFNQTDEIIRYAVMIVDNGNSSGGGGPGAGSGNLAGAHGGGPGAAQPGGDSASGQAAPGSGNLEKVGKLTKAREFKKATEEVEKKAEELKQAAEEAEKKARELKTATEEVEKKARELKQAAEEVEKKVEELKTATEGGEKKVEELKTAMERVEKKVEELKTATEGGEELKSVTETVEVKVKELKKAAETVEEKIEELEKAEELKKARIEHQVTLIRENIRQMLREEVIGILQGTNGFSKARIAGLGELFRYYKDLEDVTKRLTDEKEFPDWIEDDIIDVHGTGAEKIRATVTVKKQEDFNIASPSPAPIADLSDPKKSVVASATTADKPISAQADGSKKDEKDKADGKKDDPASDRPLARRRIDIEIENQWKTDFSVGYYYSVDMIDHDALRKHNYQAVPVGGAGSGFSIARTGDGSALEGGMAFFHRYRRNTQPTVGLTAGLDPKDFRAFLLGGSLVVPIDGGRSRLFITAGALASKVDVLRGKRIGDRIDSDTVPLKQEYRVGPAVGVSLILDLNK